MGNIEAKRMEVKDPKRITALNQAKGSVWETPGAFQV
jgi:hypothetical protein